jgi:threonine synthase
MWGFQAAGAAPLVLGHRVLKPETVATAIRIGNPASGHLALAARDESHGLIESVTDEQILSAQGLLASREGIFVEPASAAGVAGLLARFERGEVERGLTIVITVTGHGLKDVDTALQARGPVQADVVSAELDAVAAVCGLA